MRPGIVFRTGRLKTAAHFHEAQRIFRQIFILMIDNGKASVERRGIERNLRHNALGQRILSQQAGEGGDTDIPAHRAHQGLGAHAFPQNCHGQLAVF